MIQRKQTIYLLLSALMLASIFLHSFDFVRVTSDQNLALAETSYLQDSILDVYDNILFSILSGLAIILSIGGIFLYKNRKLQLTVSKTNLIVCLILLVGIGIFLFQDLQLFTAQYSLVPNFGIWSLLLAIFAIILGMKGIKKDDKLVKSMDRLR